MDIKRTRHTPEQIVRKLRGADRLLAEKDLDNDMLRMVAQGKWYRAVH
jgi:hypothetical protein